MDLDQSPEANVGSWLRDWAVGSGAQPAVVADASGERLSYAELNALANRAAHGLLAAGVQCGDRVALELRSEPLYLALYFAAAKIGAILLPLNSRLTAPELATQLEDAEPRVVIRATELEVPARSGACVLDVEEFRAQLPGEAAEPVLAPGGEAPQVLMYTSGTEGIPKGALLPHRKTLYNTLNAVLGFGLCSSDVVVVPVPLFHSFGLKILSVPALFAGARVVLVEHFDARGIQDCVSRHQATLIGGVPWMYRKMLEVGLDRERLSSLRFAFSAGAPLDASTTHAFLEAGVALTQGYGQTETSLLCCLDPADASRKPGSVGRPVRHAELRIADPEGKTTQPGVPGEIVVRGPVCMLGYWRRAEATRAVTRDGWHHTADLGIMDQEGYVSLVGRLKELYISGGENVYPAEVERVLEQHPNVAEAAVLGVDDPEWGETGRAYIVPRQEPLDRGELLQFARERLAAYKLPRQLILLHELPRTPSGKVQKHLLPPPAAE